MRIVRAKGSRQKIWNLLRSTPGLLGGQIATKTKTNRSTVDVYLAGLRKHGYAEKTDDRWALLKDTGPISPSYTTSNNRLVDLNLDPPMTGSELERIWRTADISLNAFAAKIGKGPGQSTRLREMMRGARPVGPTFEEAVKKALASGILTRPE